MQLVASFFHMLGAIIKGIFALIGITLKFSFGIVFFLLILFVLFFFGVLHLVGVL